MTYPAFRNPNKVGVPTYDHTSAPPMSLAAATNEFPSPQDSGCKGDGREETDAIQRWYQDCVAAGGGFGAKGLFCAASTLYAPAGLTVYGSGKRSCVIAKHATAPANSPLMLNEHPAYGLRRDADIVFQHVGFRGLEHQSVHSGLIAYIGVDRYSFVHCLFEHHRRDLWECGNTRDGVFDYCEFNDYGSRDLPVPGHELEYDGGAGMAFVGQGEDGNQGISITHTFIHDGLWTGIVAGGEGGFDDFLVAGCRILRVKEAGIFGGPRRGIFANNRIFTVGRQAFSAHGLELGGDHYRLDSNIIDDTLGANIYLTDVSQVGVIGNTCSRSARDMGSVGGSCAAITIRAADSARQMDQITVARNILEAGGSGTYGVAVYPWGGKPINNMAVRENNYGLPSSWRSGQTVLVQSGALGSNCTVDGDQA